MVNMNREIGVIQLCNSFHKIRRPFFISFLLYFPAFIPPSFSRVEKEAYQFS